MEILTDRIRSAIVKAAEAAGSQAALCGMTHISTSIMSKYVNGEVKSITPGCWNLLYPAISSYLIADQPGDDNAPQPQNVPASDAATPPSVFRPGDAVRLRSGGPLMTVTMGTQVYTKCVWFVGKDLRIGEVHPAALIKDQSGLAAVIEDQAFHRRLAALEKQVLNQGNIQ